MAENKYSSEGLDMFTLLLGSMFKQAANILKDISDYVPGENENPKNKEEKKEYEAPKCSIVELNKSKEETLKFPKFEYLLTEDPEEGEENYTSFNDESPIDKRMKEVLDRLIFKIRINYEGKVEYNVQLDFGKVKAKFDWNIDHDRFEGTITNNETENEVFYCETETKFYSLNDCMDECCGCEECEDECLEDAKAEKDEKKEKQPASVKFNAESSSPSRGTQIKCEEIEQKENTAEYLYRRLNANMQNKINECLSQVEIGVNKIIDYQNFESHQNEQGVINAISFPYDLIPGNFPKLANETGFDEINPEVVLNHIKEKFGFSSVTMDCNDIVYCTLK